ncbi:PilW family protein [Candidatus Symbiobacter mobilis]|uniref:Type IV pilus assembly protein PilW n=1 Tax=Candidatus Symbiobacter mobilis CR TaxID=946483 RepID=U5N6K7_9BURK|nr:PilW family protein [Candidatus Symbiobacter mobilis]AGX87176.1 type IV pilus assembly protein PilW [Candidatus Symbiobacter mobilis CR]
MNLFPCSPAPSARQRGLSLIEMMVSMALGLVLIVATLATYMGSATTARMADAQALMNEDANAVLAILSQHLRMAGNNPKQSNRTLACPRNPIYAPGVVQPTVVDVCAVVGTHTFIVRGCDGRFSNLGTATDLDALTCPSGTTTLPDSIAVSYEADTFNTEVTGAGRPTDCLGQSIPTMTAQVTGVVGTQQTTLTPNFYLADNRFYIGTSTNILAPSLYCLGNGNTVPQPLVENVEDLQFSYGTDIATNTGTLAVAGYLDAAEVLTATGLSGLPSDSARWQKVSTVRICVVMRSENPVLDNLDSARYVRCDGTLENNPPDLRLRRAYSTTVVLRNRVI